MALPSNIPGVGPVDATPLVNRQFDPGAASLTPEDYFVFSRIDGRTSLKQIVMICGFPEQQAVQILGRLRDAGAFYFQGEPPPAARPRMSSSPPARPQVQPSRKREVEIDPALLAQPADLTEDQKRGILMKHGAIEGATLFEILELDPDADKKRIKRAYFRISKDFHPDRFYGKSLGAFQQRLAEIFRVATEAFEILSDDGKRELYLERLAAAQAADPAPQPVAAQPSTRVRAGAVDREAAARLFEAACQHQVTGEVELALREFAEAVRRDPIPKYLRRASEASLRAADFRTAEEYAKKAAEIDPRDALAHRMLAKVFRAAGRTDDALRELELANRLDPESVHIAAELDELRRQR